MDFITPGCVEAEYLYFENLLTVNNNILLIAHFLSIIIWENLPPNTGKQDTDLQNGTQTGLDI
jgi:hypothetical protein